MLLHSGELHTHIDMRLQELVVVPIVEIYPQAAYANSLNSIFKFKTTD